MNLMIKTKNPVVDPEIGFLTRLISRPFDRETAMPTAWELKSKGRFPTTHKNVSEVILIRPYYVHGIINDWSENHPGGSEVVRLWAQTCLYLAPVIYPIIFCFMLSDVQKVFLSVNIGNFHTNRFNYRYNDRFHEI